MPGTGSCPKQAAGTSPTAHALTFVPDPAGRNLLASGENQCTRCYHPSCVSAGGTLSERPGHPHYRLQVTAKVAP